MNISKKIVLLSAVTVLVFGLLLLAGCGSSSTGTQALYENKCGSCHPLSTVESASHKSDEWKSVVDRMKAMNDSISDSDAEKITQYLSENFSK